ncbi:DUF4230 domain-containing protein [Polaribacter sp. WD7]|uniref:DUF4230 domain-containing protein n=1 Tax=Polaribacter sp. WD7 TaxID=2269061 RepID=UPI000DF36C01|nr:DUF4230 domain-containing protein [Polaribacter sp. WD7]RCS26289.1 DUF4230 domain-containing protein [Polaribacter sp. WD7]
MRHFLAYLLIFLFGFFIAKFWYQPKEINHQKEEIQVVLNSIQNLNKLVVSKGSLSEIYNYTDSKKYFYDYISFDKKAIVSVNADVEVGYDLSKLKIEVDTLAKQIIILKIPEEEIVISPNIKYFDLQQSSFNSFSKEELNKITSKSIAKIKNSMVVDNLKEKSKNRLLQELSRIYQLSSIYRWQVIDATNSFLLRNIKD